jgi:hypothetical protein
MADEQQAIPSPDAPASPSPVHGRTPFEALAHVQLVLRGLTAREKELRDWIAAAPENVNRWPGEK